MNQEAYEPNKETYESNKETYEPVEIEVLEFDSEDIITTSGEEDIVTPDLP